MKKLLTTSAPLVLGYASGADKKPAAKKPAAERVEPEIATGELLEGFEPPAKTSGGFGKAKYPFADLAPGGYFGVKNKTKRQMASAVGNANDRYSTVTKNADGKKVRLNIEREFYAVDVDGATAEKLKGTAFEGSKVLIVRSK